MLRFRGGRIIQVFFAAGREAEKIRSVHSRKLETCTEAYQNRDKGKNTV